ncbi:MAG: metallophosphoesterase [Ruminococcus callidus]
MILLIFIWFLIEQHLLWVHREEITLSHLPPAFDGTSLLQITDLHHREMGKNNCRIVRKAAELHPDHIVLTGDLISRDMRDFHGIASFLTALSKISPVWICVGNHELDLPPAVWEQLRQTIAQSGCRLLRNQTISAGKVRLSPAVSGGSRTGVWDLSGRQPRIPALAALYGGRPDTGSGHTAGLHGAAGT